MPAGTHLGPTDTAPHPPPGPVCGRTGPCGSYYDCKVHLGNKQQGTRKKQALLLTGPGGHWYIQGTQRCRQREREQGLGFHLYWGWGWGPRVSWVHSLLVNVKVRAGIKSMRREKQCHSRASYLNDPGRSERELHGWGGLVLYLCSWQCVFEMDALAVKSLRSGTYN